MDRTEELKRRIAATGVLSPTSKTVTDRVAAAREQAEQEARSRFTLAANERISARIRKLLGWLAVAFVAVFQVAGSLLVVILFPVAEFFAAREGLIAFTGDVNLSTLSALTVVVGLIVMYFVRRILADNLSDRPPLYLSLSRTGRRFAYFIGASKDPVDMDRSGELYVAVTAGVVFLQWTIVLLGFIGRARQQLATTASANLWEFAGDVITSDPLTALGYVGTVVLTFALLQVTDAVVLYIHGVYVDTAGRIGIGDSDPSAVVNFIERRSAELTEQVLLDLAITAEATAARKQEREQTDTNAVSGN